jgi:hypothetical protein
MRQQGSRPKPKWGVRHFSHDEYTSMPKAIIQVLLVSMHVSIATRSKSLENVALMQNEIIEMLIFEIASEIAIGSCTLEH